MSHFKAEMHQIRFRLGLHPRPHWELTALPQTPSRPSWISGGGEGKGKEGKGYREGERKEEGKEGRVNGPPRF